ncbi:unnamed protein product [Cylicocyclus nassatus]|uniref:Uncharacterized protein n=1 Tax=Cylicocyclus nassatus TaxID=53992 RepID=A0AA36GXU4_CYLNA|nr:unnamed protein product [Cylicocyclus nassatus]
MAEADEVCQPMREKQLMCEEQRTQQEQEQSMREKQPMYEEQPLPSNYPVTFEEQPMRKEQPIMLEKHFVPEEQQHEGQTVRNETPSSTLTDAPETVRTCLRNVIDVSDFPRDLYDQIAKGMLSSTDLERIICECLHEIQFDMSDLQHMARTSQLNTSSNQAEAIRSLAGVRIAHRLQVPQST